MISSIPMRIRGQESADRLDHISSGMSSWVPVDELSDAVNIGEDDPHKVFSTDEEECNFSLDAAHLETEIQAFLYTQQASLITSPIFPKDSNGSKVSGVVCTEDRPGLKGTNAGWVKQTAVLKAKCEVLRMQKEVAKQQWVERCTDMGRKSAQMARSLRVAVESILDNERRPRAISAPSTPRRRVSNEGHNHCLDERLRILKSSSAMRSKAMNDGAHKYLDNSALVFQKITDMFPKSCHNKCSNLSTTEENCSEKQKSDHLSVENKIGADTA
ncbi:uncharacterized protein [Physcomitrium patens]|uniref:Uncharacterized protein n=1 Tax=Physcomitrium patens TaxID=3218 RepID=A0A2K1KKR5_PHYPA|nr:uncharacterized protein LOC112282134 isoform X2 [Physcomitrium patens]XP_024375169.1 uncharacterized protein LOC112282134 isoform X2 [Physcomitrium patens]PNR54370.1 hypothetical protein PHYPA_008047 [Physcomitrium patens]|eukprot:XP_024375168.1 uncharacterized protein LOC112282134 isoform X2 [Physcomitrella patens]